MTLLAPGRTGCGHTIAAHRPQFANCNLYKHDLASCMGDEFMHSACITGRAQMGNQVLQEELCLTYLVEEAQEVVLICSLDLFELKEQVLPCLAVLGHSGTTYIHTSVISHSSFTKSSL